MRKLVCAALAILTPIFAFGQQLPDKPYLSLDEQSAWAVNSHRVGWALNLTQGEREAVTLAFAEYGKNQQSLFSKGAVTEDQFAQLDHALASQVLGVLDSSKRARLHQIALQLRGAPVLEDPSVVKEMAITPAQSEKIHAIFVAADKRQADFDDAITKKAMAIPQSLSPAAHRQREQEILKSMAPGQKRLAQQRRADEIKALNLLTVAQRKLWTEMLGKRI